MKLLEKNREKEILAARITPAGKPPIYLNDGARTRNAACNF